MQDEFRLEENVQSENPEDATETDTEATDLEEADEAGFADDDEEVPVDESDPFAL